MAVTPNPSLDLSKLDAWHGLRPGMTRAEAMAVIDKAGVKTTTKADEPDWLRIEGDWGMELRFVGQGGDGAGERLLQVSVEDEDAYDWGGKALLGLPLHSALRVVERVAAAAAWRPEDAVCEPSANGVPSADPEALTDEFLLSEGTLWLPDPGVGLVMADGVVTDVVWRNPTDVPRPLLGRVTDAQLELSRRPDLGEHLLACWKKRNLPAPPTRHRNVLEMALAALLVLGLAYIGWKAWQEMVSWQKAANIPGRVISIDTKPGKLAEKLYHIEYLDPTGRRQSVMLERPDFYVAPREPGEEVIVCYLGDDPPRVRGPSRAKDAAFLTYAPWAIGLLLAYMMVKLVLLFLPPFKLGARKASRPKSP